MVEIIIKALWFILAILILVPIHELGHFYAMRVFGVKVLRFSVGFGQRLWTWTDKHGTEFAISSIPLGGYVKPLDDRNEEIQEGEEHLNLNTKPEWQRIIIFFAGPFANIVLAVVFFWFILLVKGTASFTPVIGSVEPNSLAASAGLVEGQEIIAIDGEATPTRKAVVLKLLSRLGESGPIYFTTKYPDATLTYDSEAQLDNWLSDAKAPDPLAGLGFSFYYPKIETVIDRVLESSPAERAGLKSGDRLLVVDGQEIESWDSWVQYVKARPNQPLDIDVRRQGEIVSLQVTPESTRLKNGDMIGRVGVSVVVPKMSEDMYRIHHYNAFSALTSAMSDTWEEGVFIFIFMKKLVFGEISTKNLSGPIGIAKVAASHAELGFWAFLTFLARLSIMLGVMNLLPVPVLDGGHIVFTTIEWIKGSPVSQAVQVWSLNVGVMLLVSVMFVAFYNDLFGA